MRNTQNIYDDETFFEGYRKLREQDTNYNVLLEQPAFQKMLPDITGREVLDLGCGAGDMCRAYESMGARRVVGIDVSEKMLALARQAADSRVEYHRMDMCDIGKYGQQFDLVTSSLAMHYIADIDSLMHGISTCLRPGGTFLFSQEHPLTTAPKAGAEYTYGSDKRALHYNLSDYGQDGEREITWFVDGVAKYHRTFSSILNSVIHAGFEIEELCEPLPSKKALMQNRRMYKEFHKPSFLIVRAHKRQ